MSLANILKTNKSHFTDSISEYDLTSVKCDSIGSRVGLAPLILEGAGLDGNGSAIVGGMSAVESAGLFSNDAQKVADLSGGVMDFTNPPQINGVPIVAEIPSNLDVSGIIVEDLEVTQDASFNGDVLISGDLTVNGTTELDGDVTIDNSKLLFLDNLDSLTINYASDPSKLQNGQAGSAGISIGNHFSPQTQGISSISVGKDAGNNTQGNNCISIGTQAGQFFQEQNSIAIGDQCGKSSQGNNSVAIGDKSAIESQGNNSVAIGKEAGFDTQGASAVAIGKDAGNNFQSQDAVAIGDGAGFSSQGLGAVAVGKSAGGVDGTMNNYSIALGAFAGAEGILAENSIAIGKDAGISGAGNDSISIGKQALSTNDNSIVLNASGSPLTSQGNDGLFVKPIRGVAHGIGVGVLKYDLLSGEITYSTTN